MGLKTASCVDGNEGFPGGIKKTEVFGRYVVFFLDEKNWFPKKIGCDDIGEILITLWFQQT